MSEPITSLVGRDDSVAEAEGVLLRDDVRLLTITGPGGVGKTRLANAVVSRVADRFSDGVIFVPLQAVRNPGHVIGTVARSLGLFDGEGDLQQRLIAHLNGRRLLLVLDNFEQIVDAAPSIAAVVAASPNLKVTVTSRTRLRVQGEQELSLGPLARGDAMSLFLERARAVRRDFELDAAGTETLSEICGHLDDLPLAIELAATRVKVLSLSQMLARLEHRLEILTEGARDSPSRHRALRDTIGWSVELLQDDERALFRRLAVFAGGFGLEAVEDVCAGELDHLGSLVDMSLVRADGVRFNMLETIREYARELFDRNDEADGIRRAHAEHYLRFVRSATPGLTASDQASRRAALEADHDNIRAALRFSIDTGDVTTALQLSALLWRFWFERGYLSEGRLWLDESLAAPSEADRFRVRALSGNAVLAHYQGDYRRAEELSQEALKISESTNDAEGTAEACTGLALVRRTEGDYSAAKALFQQALAVYEGTTDEGAVARALDRLATCFVVAGEMDRARPRFERSLALCRRLGDSHGIALSLYGVAATRPTGGDRVARAQAEESLEILRAIGDRRTYAKALWNAADINADLGDTDVAAAQFEESLTLFVEFGDQWFGAVVLESAAFLAEATGDAERAVRLLAAADMVRSRLEVPLWAGFRVRHDGVLARVRSALGVDRFASAWDEGARIPLSATVELVAPAHAADVTGAAEGLTTRELQVLALVAEGLSDAEVAERLVVSLRTVHAHLRSIYRKLDVHSRTAATRYALEHRIVT